MSSPQERALDLFLDACDLQPAAQRSFIDQHCLGDEALRHELEILLRNDAEVEGQTTAGQTLDGFRDALVAVIDETEHNIPEQIGPYRILRVIGRGGMGTVYEAEQSSPARRIALKVIHPGFATPSLLKRFELEGELLGRLQHPGIARIFATGTADTGAGRQPYLAMELIEGCELRQGAPNDLHGKLKLLERIAVAVEHAHQRGVIHRDLKPGNVLVNKNGQPFIVDFGIARVVDENLENSLRTATGELIGTLPYMSPEQAGGDNSQVDTRTDVYALGVITYELLTGQLPLSVKGLSIPAAAAVICNQAPKRLAQLNPELGGDIETVVNKALQKESNQRYASAGAFADDLRRLRNHEPITARPPSASYEIRMLVRRHRIPAALAGLAFTLLVIGTIATTLMMFRALDAEALSDKRLKEEKLAREETDAVNKFLDGFLINSNDLISSTGTKLPYLDVLRNAVISLDKAEAGETEDVEFIPKNKGALARIYHRFAREFELLGEQDLGIKMTRRAWVLRKEYLGEGHPDTVVAGIDLIRAAIRNSKDPAEALELAESIMPHAEALPAKEYGRRQIQLMFEVGQGFMYQGHLVHAESIIRMALDRYIASGHSKGTLGADIRSGLAACQRRLGNFKEGEKLLREALEIMSREMGKESLQTTTLMSNLAVNLANQDRLDEAIPAFEKVIKIRSENFGPDFPGLIVPEATYGSALGLNGQIARAIEVLNTSIKRHTEHYGESHRNIGFPILFLARSLGARGDWTESRDKFAAVFEIWKTKLPADHHRIGRALHQASDTYFHLGDYKKALSSLSEAEEILAAKIGKGDLLVAEVRLRIASCHRAQGDLAQAHEFIKKALANCEKPKDLAAAIALERGHIAMAAKDEKLAVEQFQVVEDSKRSQDRHCRAMASLLIARLLASKDTKAAIAHLAARYPSIYAEIRGEHWLAKSIVKQVVTWHTEAGNLKGAAKWRLLLDPAVSPTGLR